MASTFSPGNVAAYSGGKEFWGGSCVFLRRPLVENGAQVVYFLETCHSSTFKDAELRDTQYGGVLSKYALKRVEGDIPPDSLRRAPAWVREIPDIDR